MSKSIDINDLSLQDLSDIRKQLEAEIDHLSQSGAELRRVLGRFIDCAESVKTTHERAKEGGEILVPLTSSLYVPGRMTNSKTFTVDIGTNYYVEKSGEDVVKFFENKVSVLNKNLVDIQKLLDEKVLTLQNMDEVYKVKFREALAKADKEK